MIDLKGLEITSSAPTITSDIKKGLKLLFQTRVGTVALDRDFGIDMAFLDMPINTAKRLFSIEIIQKAKKYEPRASIKAITFIEDAETGKLQPKVEIGE